MRFAFVAFLVLGVVAATAAVDLSAPSRTRVPEIQLRPAPLPAVTAPILPTPAPAKPPKSKPVQRGSSGGGSKPVTTPARTTPSTPSTGGSSSAAGSDAPSASSAGSSGETGSDAEVEERPASVRPAKPRTSSKAVRTAKPKLGRIAGAAPALTAPMPAGDDDDDDGDDDDDDDGGDDGGDDG